MKQEDYIKKWLDGSLSEAEKNAPENEADRMFLTRLDQSVQEFKAPKHDLSVPLKSPKTISMKFPWSISKIAASIALALATALAVIYYQQSSEIEVSARTQNKLYLPDSSFVQLNKESVIAYEDKNWSSNKTISLNGEAFFDVRKSKSFEVKTEQGLVKVIGTRFNVISRKNHFEVSCYEGIVQVIYGTEKTTLHQNESWRAINEVSSPIKLPLKELPAWINGESEFQSVPFKMVLKEFERQYDTEVNTEDVDMNRLFTGSFAHDNINLALKSISLPFNIQYQIEENQVLLSGSN